MHGLYDRIQEAAAFVRTRTQTQPRFGLVLGTGLGDLADAMEVDAVVPYAEIPHFVRSTTEGHKGNLVLGKLGGKPVVSMQGRLHYYEGYSMQDVTFPIRVLRALGAEDLVVFNAVGGMNTHLDLGDLLVVTDHINLMGDNPLIGWNDDRLGERFPDMSEPYSRARRELAERVALELGTPLRRAVLVAVAGPNLETAAEYRFLSRIGADVVGMSMVPENLVAVHAGMRVLGVCVVTDLCRPDALEKADIAKIIATANAAEPKLRAFVTEYLKRA
ncbi:MAG TPA: purine-nucleoside phosphorylase [Candidatus Krumholzibacteria bacterium]|nr:purine-nucleoside phosphorylase [Candidatus Krumholzibacteria bacterium]